MKKYYIRLDIQKPYDTEYIQVIQQDTLANTLYVTLLNSGELIPMNELTFIEVVADKPDATQWISSAEVVSDGQVKIDLDYQAIAAMGIVNISIKLYVADSVVSTYPFQIRVIADPHAGTDGSVASTSEYPILTGLINDVQAAGEVSGNMLVWEVYDPLKAYAEGNKVSYNGSSYYCKAATTGNLPTDTLYWTLIAAKGDTGEQGIQGIQGEQGIQGIQGETGEPGATWISGTVAPTTEGVDGDFYFNSVAYDMYKKTLGAWGLIANVKGIQGIQGVQGVSISSITRTAGTGAPGTLDTYTITYSDTTTSTFQVYNGADGEGAGDMTKIIYDSNNDGKVNAADNADTVNNLTVETAVPTGAVFTDTVYEHPATHSADIITDGTTNKAYTAIEKTKLTAIEAGAEVNDPIANNLTTTITGSVLDATQGKAINDSLVAHQADYTDKFFHNAGAHNSIFRGKYLGTSYTAAQQAAVLDGTFEDLYIGDYWTINTINYRIAAINYYRNTGDSLLPGNHLTLVPDTQLYAHVMNDTNITTGAYVGSKMYISGLDAAKTTIEAAFPGRVITTRNYLHNAVTNGYTSGGSWYNSKVELMTELNVYGAKVYSNAIQGTNLANNVFVDKSQFPLFALNPESINTRQSYWLRDVASSTTFARVYYLGYAYYDLASIAFGVRPAFSIS